MPKGSYGMTLSVCIPMYNESDAVEGCAAELLRKMRSFSGGTGNSFEIIFCDDGSTDDCRAKAERIAADNPEVRVIGYKDNRGKGSAVREAVSSSLGDAVLYTDCDLAYGADIIGDAVKRIADADGRFRADAVIGSRNLTKDGYNGYGLFRKLASKAYIKALSVIGGFSLTDSQCGFKIFKTESAKKIFSLCECDGFAFDYEVILIANKLGMKIEEMPVRIINHRESTVHMAKDSVTMLKDVIKIKKRVKKLTLQSGGR